MQKDELLEYLHNIFLVKQRIYEQTSERNGLSPLDVHILTFVDVHSDDSTATGIERDRRIKKNTISVHVETLVQTGYLLRESHPDDGRKVKLSLTDKGKKISAECEQLCRESCCKLAQGLSQSEIGILRRCFETINANALSLLRQWDK